MKKIRRTFLIIVILICIFMGASCKDCTIKMDNSTFDEFSGSVLSMLFSGDELTLNYYFENPENYGLEHSEPSLPTPGVSSETGKLILNLTIGQITGFDYENIFQFIDVCIIDSFMILIKDNFQQ